MYTVQITGYDKESAGVLKTLIKTMNHGDDDGDEAFDAIVEVLDILSSQNPSGFSVVKTADQEPLRQIAELHKEIAEIKAHESYGEGVDWDTVSHLEDQIVSLAIDFALATLEGGERVG